MQTKPKVAVIEDNQPIRAMYKFKLEGSGYEVYEAENGKLGLALLKESQPDLILLDLMMPEMNGDEMLAKVRETEWGAPIRVVILTNLNKSEAPHALRFLNVDRYIVKAHHTPAQVIEIIDEVLGRKTAKVV